MRLRRWTKATLAGCCTLAVAGAMTTPATSSYFYDVESLSAGISAASPLPEIAEACGLSSVEALAAYHLVWGTPGDDRLLKGDSDDTPRIVIGLAGDDVLHGNKGGDCLLGGAGNDELIGYQGTDRCVGGPGRDTFSQCEAMISDEEDPPGHGPDPEVIDTHTHTLTGVSGMKSEVAESEDGARPSATATGSQDEDDAGQPTRDEDEVVTEEATPVTGSLDDSETKGLPSGSENETTEPLVTGATDENASSAPQDQTE